MKRCAIEFDRQSLLSRGEGLAVEGRLPGGKFASGLLVFGMLWMFVLGGAVFAQEHEVTGQVTNQDGQILPGVNILVEGTQIGTATNASGEYSITVPSPQDTLSFSFVGFQTQRVPIEGRSTINVTLVPSTEALDEVVVVGYGEQTRADLTGSVSSVSSQDLENDQSTSIDQALQGRVSGVNVVRNSGRPGGDVSIQIRGLGTLNTGDGEPLYVVDGVPVSGSSGDAISNPLSTIPPQDIESIDVLKDASAAAIYGSRASNGVIEITTKRGEAGQQQVEYNFSAGLSQLAKKADVMNLQEYASFVTTRAEVVGFNTQEELSDPSLLGKGTDWQDALFKTAFSTDHNLAVSGGSEDTQYRISGGYTLENGIAIESDFERYSLRVNIDNQTKEWLKVGTSLRGTRTAENLNVTEDDVILTAIQQRPDVPVRTPSGDFGGPEQSNNRLDNPVGLARLNTNQLRRTEAVGEVFANIDFTDNLTLNNSVGGTIGYERQRIFEPTFDFGARTRNEASSTRGTQTNTFWQIRNFLNYTNTFQGVDVDLMGGHEVLFSQFDGVTGSRSGFPNNSVRELPAGNTDDATNNSFSGSETLESGFGRVRLGYGDRYNLTANVRADVASNFAEGNRTGVFPSISAAWTITNEPFLEGSSFVEVVDQLKIRGGIGYTGNRSIGQFRFGDTFTVIPTDFGSGVRASNIGNPDIKWESTESINLGLDLALFAGRINLNLDAYQRTVQDLLLNVELPLFSGATGTGSFNQPIDNIGSMENRGMEVSLSTINLDGDFRWESTLNVSANRNEVTALQSDDAVLDRNIGFFDTASRTIVGEPAGRFFGYEVEGIFTSAEELRNHALPEGNPIDEDQGTWLGDLKFKDQNGDGVINSQDRTFIGNPQPDFTYGLTNEFSYKGFDLSVFLNGSYGNDVFNQVRRLTEDPAASQNLLEDVTDYARIVKINQDGPEELDNLTVANPDTDIPRISAGDPNNNQRVSDRFIEDASYLRIQNVTLGYTLPPSLMNQIGLRKARVFTTIENVATITSYSGLDPEVGAVQSDAARDTGVADSPLLRGIDTGRFPQPRSFTFGFNLGF